jgi:dTDP-4-amino-4,6-dideoxygalactose transaminase
MPVPVADPRREYLALQDDIDRAVSGVLSGGYYILGPEVDAFEEEFADFLGVDHAIGVANGTEALLLALRALDIGEGDEVITASFTSGATVTAIAMAGATPVLADISPLTYTLEPKAVEAMITDRTRAIMPVHLYGQPAMMSDLQAIANRHGLAIVEDCAQAPGAAIGGKRIGGIGTVGCFSFYPTKNLGAIGDAGAVVTNDGDLAARLRRLRQYGWSRPQHSLELGYNSRLDELQAAILRVKLRHLDDYNVRRRAIAGEYSEAFAHLPLQLPQEVPDTTHVYHLFVVQSGEREDLRGHLTDTGIGCGIHYPLAVHQQDGFQTSARRGDLAATTDATKQILSLPMHPLLTEAEVGQVVDGVLGYYGA